MRTAPSLLALGLLLVLAPARAQEAPPPPDLTAEGMTRRFAERLRAPLERALGEPLGDPVAIAVVGSEGLVALLARENEALFARMIPDAAERAAQAQVMAQQLAPAVMGKLDEAHGRVLIQPEALRALSLISRTPDLLTQEALDVILVHEVMHVHQLRRFGSLIEWFGAPADLDQLRLRMAVIEGHAQWITRRVAEAEGLQRGFRAFHELHTKEPEGLDEASRVHARAMRDLVGFPYVEGERLFAAVAAELGPRAAAERLMRRPPTTLRQVSHPRDYLRPSASSAPDVAAYVERLSARGFPADGFGAVQVLNLPEGTLRGQIAPFVPAPLVEEAFRAYHSGRVLLAPARRRFGAQRVLAVFAFETVGGARAFLAAERALLLAKDERFTAPGSVRIVKATYAPPPLLGVEGTGYEKHLQINGQPAVVRGAVLRLGQLVVELLDDGLADLSMSAVWALAREVTGVVGGGIAAEDEARLRVDMSALLLAAELFRLERGRWPRALRELRGLVRAPRDPWGHDYQLSDGDAGPRLLSLGPDGAPGGVDLTSDEVLAPR